VKRKRVAFIVQRCGAEVNGGAELHCREFATKLAKYCETEVLTTCAIDYLSWDNHYPEGAEEYSGTVIRRFPVDEPRDLAEFNRYSSYIHNNSGNISQDEELVWLAKQGPNSSALADYLVKEYDNYDIFFFFTYLYQPFSLLPLVEDKAVLLPTAHDEWPLKLKCWDSFFRRVPRFVFNTYPERDFLRRRFPDAEISGPVIGCGVEAPKLVRPHHFREKFSIYEPFLLYAGRIDISKGCDTLFADFIKLRESEKSERKLVLMGNSAMPVPDHPDIIALGFVSDEDKWDAMAAAEWLVNPSLFESLSLILLEAWSVGTPTLVTDRCEVLLDQTKRSNGGLWYHDFAQFKEILLNLPPLVRTQLGRQGLSFVTQNYTWSIILGKLIKLVDGF